MAAKHTKSIVIRISLEDFRRLKAIQADRGIDRPTTESYSVLAHELWLSTLPEAPPEPRKTKKPKRHASNNSES